MLVASFDKKNTTGEIYIWQIKTAMLFQIFRTRKVKTDQRKLLTQFSTRYLKQERQT